MKRAFDIVIAASALTVTAPVMLGVAVAVRAKLGRPILFRQMRPGLRGKLFGITKFRTMRDLFDAAGRPLPDAERMTPLGRFLRASSLDELPELFDVLRGDMSLVGPRPLLAEYLPLYSAEQRRRHDVRPGITGWAQIHGRNAISWEEKFALDVWYVENQSWALDLKILALTAWKVIRREGISAAGEATMPRFIGSSDSSSSHPFLGSP